MSVGFGDLLRGGNAGRSAVVAGGISLHAVNTFIVATILPSVVRDIGGLTYFAWSTTLYVVGSLLAASNCARVLRWLGVRGAYRLALGVFLLGSALGATAPVMGALLAGRLVQGLGAGVLSALSFTMVRSLFPPALWSRAFTVISMAWGIATLGGPALGGVFAETLGWRNGFWALAALVPVLAVLVELCLPRGRQSAPGSLPPASLASLALLAASAMAVSVGGTRTQWWENALWLSAALAGFALFARRERRGPARVLPQGATLLATPLGSAYGAIALLLIGVSTEIFVPYFLQTLHGLSPLHAGYMSALMSAGWSVGSVGSAGALRVRRLLIAGPLLLAGSLVSLSVVMPMAGVGPWGIAWIGLALAGLGLGIGTCWPYLGTSVFAAAPAAERDLASASITTITMLGNAFGSALGGMVTNLAGLAEPGLAAGLLFGLFAVAPLLALRLMRQMRVSP